MAKDANLLTSRWLILAGIGCAVLAAVAVNLYISSLDRIETFPVVQVTKDFPEGGKVTLSDVQTVVMPKRFEKTFERAYQNINLFSKEGKICRRKLSSGDILFATDFEGVEEVPVPVRPPVGYEYISLPILKDFSPGAQLQPKSYVALRGRFDIDPDPKHRNDETFTVIPVIEVQTLDDSSKPQTKGGYSRIGVFVKREDVKLLTDILDKAEGRKFLVTLTPTSPTMRISDPTIDPAVLRLLRTGKADAADPLVP